MIDENRRKAHAAEAAAYIAHAELHEARAAVLRQQAKDIANYPDCPFDYLNKQLEGVRGWAGKTWEDAQKCDESSRDVATLLAAEAIAAEDVEKKYEEALQAWAVVDG